MLSTSEDELDEQACAEGVLDLVYLGDVKDIDPSNLAGERPLARRGRRRERSEHGRSRGCANTASALRVRAKKPRGAREKDDCPRPRTRGRKGRESRPRQFLSRLTRVRGNPRAGKLHASRVRSK